jgi:type I restriction enzyme S subunit
MGWDMVVDSREVARAHLADAGVDELPADWDVVTLGDLFAEERGIAVGVMYPGDHVPDGIPLIKAGDLNGSTINPQPGFRISKDKHFEYRRTALVGGELLMTLVGNVGQCAVVPPRMSGWNAARAVAVMRFSDSSDTEFVQQCLLSRPLQHLMDVWCNTTVQATLNLKEIRQLPLPWPPKPCRDAIAAFGKALTDKIELNRRMNATLEAMARALFQSWFVDFDPVRAKLDGREPAGLDSATASFFPDSFQDSAVGQIPHGWRAAYLGDVVEVFDSKRIPLSGREREQRKGQYPYHGAASVMDYVDGYLFDGVYMLLGEDGSVVNDDGSPVTQYVWGRFWVNNHAHVLRGKCGICTEHALLHLRNSNIAAFVTGAVQPKLNQGNMNRIPFILPPLEIGEEFARTIEPLFAKIRANSDQSRTLATLRDTLLPKLLSGEFRVHERSEPMAETIL